MPRPLIATIDVNAMRHNLCVAKKQVPHAKIWAVVKANAYGHGLLRGMRGFAAADGLALIEIEGAIKLREMGWNKPILLLEGFFDSSDLPMVAEYGIGVCIHSQEQIDMLEQAQIVGLIHVHLKMNSGMNRLGFIPEAYATAYKKLRALPNVGKISLMTHFANADDADNHHLTLIEQMQRFYKATEGIAGELSLSNSAADLLHPEIKTDWIRPGIMLYGGTPSKNTAEALGLRPVMTLTSEIIGIQTLKIGDAVGYGSQFVADRVMRIGVVACGYADGYPRHAPNGTPIIVDGIRTRIIGRVSMDMITVDLTPIATARIGSSVTLWGNELAIDEVAQAAGTIGYELMCALAPRVHVIDIEGSK